MGKNIAVIGAGSWGTALVKLLSSNAELEAVRLVVAP